MKRLQVSSLESDYRMHYEKCGFVALKQVIPIGNLIRFQEEFSSLLDAGPWSGVSGTVDEKLIVLDKELPGDLYKFQVAASGLSSLFAIAGSVSEVINRLIAPVQHSFLSGVGLVLGIPGSSRLSYGWHQDGTYHEGNQTTIHVWFPVFSRAVYENGAMSMLEASHLKGTLEYNRRKFVEGGYTTNEVEGIGGLLDSYPEVICELEPQDCLFFCDDVIHKSNSNDTDKCRVAGVFKFGLKPSQSKQVSFVGV